MKSFAVSLGVLAVSLVGCGPSQSSQDSGTDSSADSSADAPAGPPGSQYCRSVPNPTCPASTVANCGACVTPPEDPVVDRLKRTPCAALPERPEFCDSANPAAAPDLSCFLNFDPANPPTPPASRTVTVWGAVGVFGTGGDSNNITVKVYEVGPNGTLGAMVGQATTSTAAGTYTESERVLDNSGNVTQMRTLGSFKISGIQTEHPYIVMSQGPAGYFEHPIYDYTLNIRNQDIAAPPAAAVTALGITGDAVRIRVRTISNSDWLTVPSVATLPTGIPTGHGVLAGEVHDCADIRLSNAMVHAYPPPGFMGTVYFSDNPTNPLPDTSRSTHGTQLLGLYALLDTVPGATRVSALGYAPDGTLVHLGTYGVQMFPNAVTVVTFRGIRPWQIANP